jgi:hypothetical protein
LVTLVSIKAGDPFEIASILRALPIAFKFLAVTCGPFLDETRRGQADPAAENFTIRNPHQSHLVLINTRENAADCDP